MGEHRRRRGGGRTAEPGGTPLDVNATSSALRAAPPPRSAVPLPVCDGKDSAARALTSIIVRLKSRAQFLAAAKGASVGRGAVVVQMLHRQDDSPTVGEGFTATKKIGNAVARNRAKRRLREAARALLPLHGVPGRDYVFIARMGAGERPWARLLDDVGSALIGLAAGRDEPRPPRRPKGAPRRPAHKSPNAPAAEPGSPDG